MSRSRPNIIISVCHDLGRHLHCYGIDAVRSPNIDRMAAEGVRFSSAFCVAPQCSPSRAALFTGRNPHNNGVMGLTHAMHAWDLHRDERHLASLLRGAGYATALVGIQHETRRPDDMGYDVNDPKARGHADHIGASAAEYLRGAAANSEPFFIQIGFSEPHRMLHGFDAAPDYQQGVHIPPYLCDEPSAREDFACFQGAISKLDDAWGQVMRALDETKLADNTLVIFTTDHGIPFPRAKCSLYDPGLEIAQIARWPAGGWSGGRVVDAMLSNIDVLPTILDVAGVAVPTNVQGQSFAHLAAGAQGTMRDAVFGELTYHDYFDPRRCIRTDAHKLIVNFTRAPHFMDPTQQWRPKTITTFPEDPTRAPREAVELYDLHADPLEHRNLATSPEHAVVRCDLLKRLHQWMIDTADPLLDGFPLPPMYEWAMNALKTGEVEKSSAIQARLKEAQANVSGRG